MPTSDEKVKAERDVILDQHKDADFQGDMIKDIGNNIKGANNNLVGINADLKQQGEKITNVGQTTSKNNRSYSDLFFNTPRRYD